jgi:hypothetical protein
MCTSMLACLVRYLGVVLVVHGVGKQWFAPLVKENNSFRVM